MFLRKLIVNFLFGFLIIPFFLEIKYWTDFNINIFTHYDSVWQFLKDEFLLNPIYYIISFVVFCIILVPFQLIKDFYFKRGRPLSFLNKIFVSSLQVILLIIVFGTFSNIWQIPFYKNFIYLIYAFIFGSFCTTFLYFTIDRFYESRKSNRI